MIIRRMDLGFDPPKLRGSIKAIRYPAFVELKYDGELNQLRWENGEWYLVNKYNKARFDCAAFDMLPEPRGEVIAWCELVYESGKFGDLYNLLKNKTNDSKLNIRIFDMEMYDGRDYRQNTLSERRVEIRNKFLSKTITNGVVAYTEADVKKFYKEAIDSDYEGVVVKNLTERFKIGAVSWVKVKKKDQNEYMVLEIDPVKERIEVAVHTAYKTKRVGVKCMNKDKETLELGDLVVVEHQGILETGGLRHPVFIRKAM